MNNAPTANPWFSTYNLPQQGQQRVFAFPYSGAGASIFYQWARDFHANGIDFLGVQPPGRENRLREQTFHAMQPLLEALLPAITPLLDKPFVLFGHSLGALVGFNLCRALHQQGLPLPQTLFISAFRSPELPNPNRELHRLPEADLLEGLRDYAGTPEEILTNREIMAFLLPLLRADFSLHETWRYQPAAPLPCPITILSGDQDHIARPESMLNWVEQTSGGFQHRQYAGDHFFLNTHRSEIIRQLQQAFIQQPNFVNNNT